ncbi:MAG: rhodanese-like domain-containing protein [Saprospiraceae bacterium]|nr:rhodanese-like domain-containing protein [Saprospiraceae bacterium]
MTKSELQNLLQREDIILIDVREPFEFGMDHIKGAINYPLGDIPTKVGKLKNMDKPIILYCASGNRSGQAAEFLKAHGLLSAYNAGGIEDVRALMSSAVH